MTGRVDDGQRVTVAPVDTTDLRVADIVLVRVSGRTYLHLIKATEGNPPKRFLIGNNRGGINGWVGPNAIYGRAVAIE